MKLMAKILLSLIVLVLLAVAMQFALIEIGREVVVIQVETPDGNTYTRRLWAVDYDGGVWVHSAGSDWLEIFPGETTVSLERNGIAEQYLATPKPGPHEGVHNALREKYGNADRWVRFLGPDDEDTLVVRLDKL